MSTNEMFQNYNEYNKRKKRIDIFQSYKDQTDHNLNEIKDIDEEIKLLELKKKKKLKEFNDYDEEKLKEFSAMYNNKELLSQIVEFAKLTTYSRSVLEDIKPLCETGINSDDINWDLLKKIIYAEETINKELKHTNRFNDILNNLGNSIKLPGEED